MRNTIAKLTFILGVFFLIAVPGSGEDQYSSSPHDDQLGTIHFPLSGNLVAQEHFIRGIKLLHHMTYAMAEKEFLAAIESDPDCAMAYWGQAMTFVHPVWPDIPTEERLRVGWALIEEARSHGPKTERESDYIETLAAYFENGWELEEKDRLLRVDAAWDRLQAKYPKDLEAAAFYALFHLGPARFLPPDDTYEAQIISGSIAEEILESIPDHPGALHYQIHAYDFPALADRAIEMCGIYGDVAPNIPHALHMPTHIYTRAGMWEKSISMNLLSAQASLDLSAASGVVSNEYLHALDYAVYAYLQQGRHEEARKIRDELITLEGPFLSLALVAGAYALAAIPARCALEDKRWEDAAQIELRQPASFPWDERFIAQESMIYFARAMGAVRSGDLDTAREEIEAHRILSEKIAAKYPVTYWDAQARTQQGSLLAWLAFAAGKHDSALILMREAAALEAITEKEAVTPGEVLPAGELLGDMLIEMELYADAAVAYQSVLERSPNRFNSLYGTGRAAEAAGDQKTASRYYTLLLDLGAKADSNESRLQHARTFLAAN